MWTYTLQVVVIKNILQQMWTLVRLSDDDTVDIVPDKWIASKTSCWYPSNERLSTIKSWAKSETRPREDWEMVEITIIEGDIGDYEKGCRMMVKAARHDKLHSENEVRGRGYRMKKRPLISSSSEDESIEVKSDLGKEKNQQKSLKEAVVLPPFPSRPIADKPQGSSGKNESSLPSQQATSALSQQATSVLTQEATLACCLLTNKQVHRCAFSIGKPLSLSAVAQQLCLMSADILKVKTSLKYLASDIEESKDKQPRDTSASCGSDDVMYAFFPMKDVATLELLEQKLKEEGKVFLNKLVLALTFAVEGTTISRVVGSTLRLMFDNNLAACYSWKGQKHKKALCNLEIVKIILGVVKNKFPNSEKQEIKCIQPWLAQAPTRLQRMPRNYKRLKPSKASSPEALRKAIADIDNGLSFRQAAKKYDIHYSVLYRHHTKRGTIKKRGGQTALSEDEEATLVSRLITCSDWGYPIDSWTLRLLIKESLDRQGKTVRQFKDNMPGRDFVEAFLKRHSSELSLRLCQNIKRARADITPQTINEYFDRLESELTDVPPSHVVNYDESNLCDDPGKTKVITRRGCKYPERVMNSSKASTSVMFSATRDGVILPPYVVYKSLHLYESWREGGPDGCRYNRTRSGWFDSFCFSDWVDTVALPFLRRLDGKKYLIGDNLASHLSLDVVQKCAESNVHFIFLPRNSTHLTQPLDVAFFRPMKITWRNILLDWKKGPGRNEATIPKAKFPRLLRKLCETFKKENVISGFLKCGIVPLDRKKVLNMLPSVDVVGEVNQPQTPEFDLSTSARLSPVVAIDQSFKELLIALRHSETPQPRKKRVKVNVQAGKSVSVDDFSVEVDPEQNTAEKPSTSGTSTRNSKNRKITSSVRKPTKRSRNHSTEQDSDGSIQDSDPDLILSTGTPTTYEEPHYSSNFQDTNSSLQPGDFSVVNVFGKAKKIHRMYICKVTELQDDGFVGLFYKKCLGNTFSSTEEGFFHNEDVVKKLMPPVGASKSSSRLKDKISFQDDLSEFTIY